MSEYGMSECAVCGKVFGRWNERNCCQKCYDLLQARIKARKRKTNMFSGGIV